MGLFDLFSKEARAKSAVESASKTVVDKLAHSPDRYAAMERLRQIGSEEALYGIARRWSFHYDKTIEDEQEKEWVAQTLASLGDRAVAPLVRYSKSADSLSYALGVLEKVTKTDQMLEILDELLGREEPGYTRDPNRKVQLLTWMGEFTSASHEDIARRAAPYLVDFDEQVRFLAADVMEHHKHEASAKAPLIAALLRKEEESRRIKVRIAEILADAGWSLGDDLPAVTQKVAAELPEFTIDQGKLLRRGKRE